MPVISMFYGLIIAMYYLDTKQHNLPHVHVKYGEMEAVFQIPEGELLEGKIPANKEKLIKAWIEIHKEDLMTNWELAVTGNAVFRIDPLKEFDMNPRVSEVKYEHPYKLILTFTNGEIKEFDFENYLNYPVYEKLKNPVFCSTVKVFLGTAVWDEDIDFAPDTLYLESKPVLETST